jgi:hypothetical protein
MKYFSYFKDTKICDGMNFYVISDVCKVMHDSVLTENVHQFKSLIIWLLIQCSSRSTEVNVRTILSFQNIILLYHMECSALYGL